MSFCAICTADIVGDARTAPLGRDGALVTVCESCDDVHPRSGRYSFEGGRASPVPGESVRGIRDGRAAGRRIR